MCICGFASNQGEWAKKTKRWSMCVASMRMRVRCCVCVSSCFIMIVWLHLMNFMIKFYSIFKFCTIRFSVPLLYWFQVHRNNEYVYETRNVPCHAYTKIGSSFIFAWGVWENEKKVIKQQIEMFSFLFIEQNR